MTWRSDLNLSQWNARAEHMTAEVERCPLCSSLMNQWVKGRGCPLGCDIHRCDNPDCRELYAAEDGCQHGGKHWCPCCLTNCPECADGIADDMAAEAAMEDRR